MGLGSKRSIAPDPQTITWGFSFHPIGFAEKETCMSEKAPLRVMALHALEYCERLFYLEEVEEIRVADERVYAGRTLHEALSGEDEFVELVLEDENLGLKGKLDALRKKDGSLVPYEHKRGRSRSTEAGPAPWASDRLQVGAYALLVERATGKPVFEGCIRYHGDNVLLRLTIDEVLREDVKKAVARAQQLIEAEARPPVTLDERRCAKCSLAPICLPEEARLRTEPDREPTRLFPVNDERQVLHIFGHGTRIGRKGEQLHIESLEEPAFDAPIQTIRSVTLHSYATISAQALSLCADQGIAVHWFSSGGWYNGTFFRDDLAVQRKIRQYEALREPAFRLTLARRLVEARAEGQLKFLMRSLRGSEDSLLSKAVEGIRDALKKIGKADNPDTLLGIEGSAAAAYFEALPDTLSDTVSPLLAPKGRSRRPPRDRFNALLSFGYGLLLREVIQSLRTVGLEPGFGFYHRPRSAAPPLALDLIELFRVPCVDMAVVGAVNRCQFDIEADFRCAADQVWLSESGRKKLIGIFERRLADVWKHPMLGYSLSYRRHIELETRLLEKEWSGEPGLFAKTRIR
jgi:CRISPR-associated protein Cas1